LKFKLDENLGTRTQHIFRQSGHDVETIYGESLSGSTDQTLYAICQEEKLCLVTLDLDFSNILRFRPDKTGGIIVIRVPRNPSLPVLEQLVRQFLDALSQMSVDNQLWIVELGRIRIHQSDSDKEA
jgi:predicted nuclease of predicted toxin-antitoxin system